MKRKRRIRTALVHMVLLCGIMPAALLYSAAHLSADGGSSTVDSDRLVIDDFSDRGEASSSKWQWRLTTDRVMGGKSEAQHSLESDGGRPFIRLTGTVSLENRGGFVQITAPLSAGSRALDAADYTGVELRVRGNGETYSVHLRTGQTKLPWQYFKVDFKTDGEWRTVRIPFSDFRPSSIRSPNPDTSRLKQIGIVASEREFRADVSVSYVGFYR